MPNPLHILLIPFSSAFNTGGKTLLLRKTIGIFILVIGLSCVSDKVLADQSAGEVELRLWHSWTGRRQSILESIVRRFNCRQRQIKVYTEQIGAGRGTVAERMMMRSATADVPDLILIERDTIPLLVDAGTIRSLDGLIEYSELLHKGNLLDAASAYTTYKGHLYGLPVRVNPYVLAYDARALSRAGISSPPHDWDSFIRLAGFLSENAASTAQEKTWGLSVTSMASIFYILCLQRDVDCYDGYDDNSQSDSLRSILNFVGDLRQTHSLLPPKHKIWDPRHIGFEDGRTFFYLDSAAMVARLAKMSLPLPSVTTVPSNSSSPCTYLSHSSVFAVCSSSEKDEALLRFLEFFYSPDMYSIFVKWQYFVSPLRSTITALEEVAPDKVFYSQLASAAGNADIYPLDSRTGVVTPLITRVVEQLDAGLISPEQATDLVQEAMLEERNGRVIPVHAPVCVSWAESTRRIYAHSQDGLRQPPVTVLSGQNEHESFQLVLSAEEAVEGLGIVGTPFVSNTGQTFESPMTLHIEIDTEISIPMATHAAGLYPNVLKPQDLFRVIPGVLTRVWVDMFVADEVPAGEYSSEIVIQERGAEIARIPIHLEVLPLKIPEEPSIPTSIGLNYDRIARHYELEEGSAGYRNLMDLFYWFLVDHRMSPYQPPVPTDSTELNEYLNDQRVSTCRLGIHPLNPGFQEAVDIAKEGGWLKKLFVYFIDEPTYHRYGEILESGKLIHALENPPRFLVTCFPDEPLVGAVDIWGVHLRFVPQGIPGSFLEASRYVGEVNERLKAGDDVWWYTAGAIAPFPTLHIEDDPAAFRIIPWLQQLYRISGFLHWEATNWNPQLDEPFIKFFGNGEGVLLYPGEVGPNPSVRLKLLREGLEDMEYLMLLRRNMEGVQKKLGAERMGDVASVRIGEMCRRLIRDDALQAHVAHDLLLVPHFIREPGHIERIREELIDEIVILGERPYALVLTEPEEKHYTDSPDVRIFGVAEAGCTVEVNGHTLAVGEAGDFSARFPLSSGSNVFSIHLRKGEYSKTMRREVVKI